MAFFDECRSCWDLTADVHFVWTQYQSGLLAQKSMLIRGSECGLVFSVICPQFLVFAVKLANILMFTVFGENTV